MKKKSRIIFALILGFLWLASMGLVILIAGGLHLPYLSLAVIVPLILSVVIYFLSFKIWEKEE